jgi:hypothetical protein
LQRLLRRELLILAAPSADELRVLIDPCALPQVSATGTTIQNSFCYNQDDCLAINKGSNIQFLNNFCSGGHGISIGSIQEGSVVEYVSRPTSSGLGGAGLR